ncbi:MAG: S8 family peptidase, partial [Desulfobacteraceae bacterium]
MHLRKTGMSFGIYFFIIFLIDITVSYAQSSTFPDGSIPKIANDVYIIVMSQDPAITYQGGLKSLAATKPQVDQRFNVKSAQTVEYVNFLKSKHDAVLKAVNAKKIYDYTTAINGFAAVMSAKEAAAMADQPGVASVIKDEMRYAHTDITPFFLGLNYIKGPWSKKINGEGTIVGIIDSGIWPEHPSFADDGSYDPLDIQLDSSESNPCNFGNTSHNATDQPFECNNKLIGARQFLEVYKMLFGINSEEFDSARDDEGHGTHTASTAAGNSGVKAKIFGIERGYVSGIAPRARIIAYKGLGVQGGLLSDLVKAIDQAVADGCDVINYSVGSNDYSIDADALAYLTAANAGVFVAVSAGNDGPKTGTIGAPASAPWVTAVGANTHSRAFISDITLKGPDKAPTSIWGGSTTPGIKNFNLVDAEGIADETGDTSGQCLNPFPENTFKENDAVLCNQFDFGVLRSDRVSYVKNAGGGAVIFHNCATVNMTPTDNHPLPTVHMLHEVGNPLKEYISANPGQVTISFSQSKARYAGYDFRVIPRLMASFSARGPNLAAEDIIKPDITAPGISILAGASPVHSGTAAQNEHFQSIMGTSMASPQVAGLFALLKQAHPEWSAAMAKSALMTSASSLVLKNNEYSSADPFDAGAGHVDVSPIEKNSAFSPGLVYDIEKKDYYGFLCGNAPDLLTELPDDAEKDCELLASENISFDASNLNLPSIGIAKLTGRKKVVRTVTNVSGENQTFQAKVIPPKGFTAKVEPGKLSLANGESASVSITITNSNA